MKDSFNRSWVFSSIPLALGGAVVLTKSTGYFIIFIWVVLNFSLFVIFFFCLLELNYTQRENYIQGLSDDARPFCLFDKAGIYCDHHGGLEIQ